MAAASPEARHKGWGGCERTDGWMARRVGGVVVVGEEREGETDG